MSRLNSKELEKYFRHIMLSEVRLQSQQKLKNVAEYYKVTPRYGTRSKLKKLYQEAHKKKIIADYLNEYLVPSIFQRTNHSWEAGERYIRDYKAVKMLAYKFEDNNTKFL